MDHDRGCEWIVVADDRPRCERCGATWDRTLAAEADATWYGAYDGVRQTAVLAGLLAFVAHHSSCAAEAGPVAEAPVVDRGKCPECGRDYGKYRRCYRCHPPRARKEAVPLTLPLAAAV